MTILPSTFLKPAMSPPIAALLLLLLLSAAAAATLDSGGDPCPARSDGGGGGGGSSCPVKCFLTDPVCGEDGVTYWCGCKEAACAGVGVAKLGVCRVGNGSGSGLIAGQAFLLVHIVFLIILGFAFLFDVL